jgi:multidrug efflux pump subunit AcrB
VGIGGAILMLLLLQAAFGAWRLAFLVLLAMPAAAAGGVLLGLVTGELLTLGALAGFLLVIAITVRHAVALIDRFRRLEREGTAPGLDVATAGVQERLVPILTTVLATAVFAVPFVVLGDVAGLEILRPMAIFALGSLVSASLLILFIVPSIYLLSGPSPESETESLLSEPPALEPSAA